MKKLLVLISIFSTSFSFGQKSDTSLGKPIFWYRVSDPWATFMGAEGPPFILYNTGKIIFWKNGHYKIVEITDEEKGRLISELNLNDKIFQQSKFIDATNDDTAKIKIIATDQPSYSVYINFDTLIRVSVSGYMQSHEYRKRFPRQILSIHQFIIDFDDDQSSEWIPDKIEVLLSDYSHSPDIPIQWPIGWPNTISGSNRNYASSIFLDKKYFSQLVKLIKKRKEKQAFEINGHKYFVGYRFPIPGLY